MTFDKSLSAYIPIAHKDNANIIMKHLGFGSDNFSVRMSPNGLPNVTSYGFHAADDGAMFGYLNGDVPFTLPAGMSQGTANAVLSAIKLSNVDASLPAWGVDNFDAHAAANVVRQMVKDET